MILRGGGDGLLAVACAMLSNHTLFDPTRYAAQPTAATMTIEMTR